MLNKKTRLKRTGMLLAAWALLLSFIGLAIGQNAPTSQSDPIRLRGRDVAPAPTAGNVTLFGKLVGGSTELFILRSNGSSTKVATLDGSVAIHGSTHEAGGDDEISVQGLLGLLGDAQTPLDHKASHQNDGDDEINVNGLQGLLLDPQTPTVHGTAHEYQGADEINVTDLGGLLADAQTPLAHKTSHQEGGGDELNLDGLSGLLADAQTALAHKTSHENGGGDEISVAGLSGLLADAQTPTAHATSHNAGGSDAMAIDASAATGSLRTLGTSSTSACAGDDSRLSDSRAPTGSASGDLSSTFPSPTVVKLNGRTVPTPAANGFVKTNSGNTAYEAVAYGSSSNTVCQGDDSRLSDSRTPTAHRASHISGGSDAFLSTDVLEAIVKRIQTTTGPTTLTFGAIADGTILNRSGTGVVGSTPAALSLISGTGTVAQIPYFSDANTLTSETDQLTWVAATNRLGIGISAPVQALHVVSGGANEGPIFYGSLASNGNTVPIVIESKNAAATASNVSIEGRSVSGANSEMVFRTAGSGASTGTERMSITNTGNIRLGPSAALATNATDGFPYIITTAGVANGTPTTVTGSVPLVYNTTSDILQIYNGAWKTLPTTVDAAQGTASYRTITTSAAQRITLAAGTAGNGTAAASSNHTHQYPVTPGVSVYNSAPVSAVNATTTYFTFDTEAHDLDTMHSTVSNTGRITITTAGVYLLIGQIEFASNATNNRGIVIRMNGSLEVGYDMRLASNGVPSRLNCSVLVNCAAADYFELGGYNDSGSALNMTAGVSFFKAHYQGPAN